MDGPTDADHHNPPTTSRATAVWLPLYKQLNVSHQIFELVSEDTVIVFTRPTFFHCQGAHALHLRTAASSAAITQKHTWNHVYGDTFNFSLAEEIQNIFICLCLGYNVSLCSLIHVFVWNTSHVIKQTIKHNQSTLLRNQRDILIGDGGWTLENKTELINGCKACAYTNV